MPNFKVTLAYDGTDFVGWQRQAAGASIQGLLEDALQDLEGRKVTVVGAGRTDAGVHALGQVASISLTRSIQGAALVGALNARLPGTVRVLDAEIAPEAFHARFDAKSKTYRYRIWNADVLDPFERHYSWHVMGSLDRDAMAASARLVEGRHDFAAFQTGGAARSTVREVFSSRLIAGLSASALRASARPSQNLHAVDPASESGKPCATTEMSGAIGRGCDALITYEITGDGFLRHMVRTLVGTLVEIGRGRRPIDWMREVLAGRDRSHAGPTAPPEGLVLVTVEYPSRLLATDRSKLL